MNDSRFQIVLKRNRINFFFVFTLLNRPRKREAVKRMDIKTFVVSVKEAIASVHTILRIAHPGTKSLASSVSITELQLGEIVVNEFTSRRQ